MEAKTKVVCFNIFVLSVYSQNISAWPTFECALSLCETGSLSCIMPAGIGLSHCDAESMSGLVNG